MKKFTTGILVLASFVILAGLTYGFGFSPESKVSNQSVVFTKSNFSPTTLNSQSPMATVLINPAGDGGFETGADFTSNGWTVSNSANNPWVVGNAIVTPPFVNRSAYISNDAGVTNAYTNTLATLNYFYRDVTIPAGETKIQLSFNWVGNGESTWDMIQVFVAPTSITPVGTTTYPGSGTSNVPSGITGATFVGYVNLQTTIQNGSFIIPGTFAGQTVRLIFAWKSDTSGGSNPSGSVDNISLVSSVPVPLTGGTTYPINNVSNPPVEFKNITEAAAYIGSDGITGTGQVIFELGSNYSSATEPGPISINNIPGASSTLGVTFRPAEGLTSVTSIAGTSTFGFAIRLNACSYVTLDGRSGGTGTTRDWTIANTGTTNAISSVRLDNTSGAMTNINIRNLIMEASATGTTAANFQIGVSSTAANTIANVVAEENLIQSGATLRGYGITIANASNVLNTGVIVRNNEITKFATNGIRITGGFPGIQVYGNNIYHTALLAGSGEFAGIYFSTSSSTGAKIYNNYIHDFQLSSATTGISGIQMLTSNTTGEKVAIYNNRIDIGTGITTTTIPVYGINYSTTTTTNPYNIYNNTVRITGTPASGSVNSAAIRNNGSTALDIKNNIFFNSRSGGTGRHWAIMTTTTTFFGIGYNDYFANGATGGVLGTTTGAAAGDKTTLAAWNSAVTTDRNSVSVLPNLLAGLLIDPTLATPIESGGITVAGVTSDFAGTPRYPNTGYPVNPSFPPYGPDMGANEFAGQWLDVLAPIITYTPLSGYTGSTTARTLTATITDVPSGVPTSGTGLPVLYWNKNSGSYSSAQGVSIGSNQYTFTFGSGVVLSDTVRYYVVAQDNAGTPNVTSNPFTGAAGFTANPPAAATPTTTPNAYVISDVSLAGDYTVGLLLFNQVSGKNITFEKSVKTVKKEVVFDATVANEDVSSGIKSKTSSESLKNVKTEKRIVDVEEIEWVPMENGKKYEGDLFVKRSENPNLQYPNGVNGIYATITAAANDLNLRGVSGPVRFLFNDATYPTETYPIQINVTNENMPTATNTVTFKPNTGVTTLIQGASAAAPIFLIKSSYVTIDGSNASAGTTRDLTIENTSATTPQVIAVGSTGTTPIINTAIKNCNIINGVNTSSAVIVRGADGSAGYFNNITIQNNLVQKAYIGIYNLAVVSPGNGSGLLISNNSLNATVNPIRYTGIYAQGIDGLTISGNQIANFDKASSEDDAGMWLATGTINATIEKNEIYSLGYTGTGGYGAYGVKVSTASTNANVTIKNNIIYDMTGDGWSYTGALGDNPMGMYIFSVQTGINVFYNSIHLFGNTLNQTDALSIGIGLGTGTTADLRNNVIVNNLGLSAATGLGSCAIFAQSDNTQFSDINYNDYYVNATGSGIKAIGKLSTTTTALTLTDWKTATGKDVNSISGDPKFLSNTDLKINTSHPFSPVLNAGTPITGITTDFYGNSRSETTPDMGMFELPAPGAFSLVAPPFDTTGMATTVNFSWTASTNVGIYTFQLSKSNLFDTLISNDTVFTGTTKSVSGLSKSTLYFWRVKAISGAGATNWLESKFTTASTPLPVTLVSPNNATKIRVAGSDFKWVTPQIPNLLGFVFQVTKDTTGAPVVSDTINLIKNGLDSIYTYNKGGFEYFTNYYWRVAAKNDFGVGDYSLYFKFQTELGPPPVSPIFPPNDTTGIFPALTLNWPDAPGAVTYRVQLSADSLFGTTILNIGGLPVSQAPVPAGYLMPMTKYYWRVNSTNADTTTGWTPTFRFNTLGQPMSVVLNTPANLDSNVAAINTVFKWFKAAEFTDQITDVKSGRKSEIEKDENEAISKYWFELVTDTTTMANLVRDSLLTDTVKTLASLNTLTNYYFRVRAKNEIDWGTFSGWNKFKTTLALPTLLTPANNATEQALTQTFDWSDAPTATSYDFQLATDAAFTAIVYNITGLPVSTFTTPVNLIQFTQYYWRARSTGPIGTTPYYTSPFTFKTRPDAPVAPALISPANNSTGLTLPVTLTWSKISNAYSYRLQVATDTAFTNLVVNDSTLTDTLKSVEGLQTLTTYYWRVNVKNSAGTSPYAGPWNFRGLGIPNSITLVSPANGAIDQPVNINFIWRKAVEPLLTSLNKSTVNKVETDDPNAISKYYFELTQDTVTFTGIYRDSTVTDTTLYVDSLQNNRTYFWRVKAKNEVGNGNFSAWFRFKTMLANPVFPILVAPANNAINQRVDTLVFQWRKVNDNVLANMQSGKNANTETDVNTSRGDEKVSNDKKTVNKEVMQTDEINAISMYIFQLAMNDTLTIVSQDTNLAGPSDTTLTKVGFTNNKVYYWRVKAKNQVGDGPFAPWFKFTTIVAAPIAPVLTTPANNSTGISVTPAFVWGAVTGATTYRIQVSASNTFGTTLLDSAGITGTTVTMPAGLLTGATTYYWRVSAANVGGISPYSTVFNFKTAQNMALNLKAYLEGFYSGPQIPDTIRVYLANSTAPFAYVDTAKVVLSSTGTASISFTKAVGGSYYIVVSHRNHLDTWSKLPQTFSTGGTVNYDFTTAATQAYGNNMKQVGSVWVIYGGDANRDGSVDAMDVPIFIAQYGTQGYLAADFNGDGDVNALDVSIFVSNFGLTKAVPIATFSPVLKTKEHDLTRILDGRKKTKETVNTQDNNVKKNEVKKNNN